MHACVLCNQPSSVLVCHFSSNIQVERRTPFTLFEDTGKGLTRTTHAHTDETRARQNPTREVSRALTPRRLGIVL